MDALHLLLEQRNESIRRQVVERGLPADYPPGTRMPDHAEVIQADGTAIPFAEALLSLQGVEHLLSREAPSDVPLID
jgi:hypothetical protein